MQKNQLISVYRKKIQANPNCLLLIYKELSARAKADTIIKNLQQIQAVQEGNYAILQAGTNFLLVVKKRIWLNFEW